MRAHVDAFVQQEFNSLRSSVTAGIAEGRFYLLFGYARLGRPIGKEKLPHLLDATHARGSYQVQSCASLGQEFGRARLAVVQASPDRHRVVAAGTRVLDGGAMLQK